MPRMKSRLSKAEQANYLRCLKELQRGGGDGLEIPGEWLEGSCPLDIVVGSGPEADAVESPHGSVSYVIHARFFARQAHITLVDCQMETPWDTDIILGSFQQGELIYLLGSLQDPAKVVLNDRIENYLKFHYRGQLVEGVILFSGFRPIPAQYRGMFVPFELMFLDQFGQEISSRGQLFVERKTQPKHAVLRPKSDLFEPIENPCPQLSGYLRMQNEESISPRPSGGATAPRAHSASKSAGVGHRSPGNSGLAE